MPSAVLIGIDAPCAEPDGPLEWFNNPLSPTLIAAMRQAESHSGTVCNQEHSVVSSLGDHGTWNVRAIAEDEFQPFSIYKSGGMYG